MKHFNFSLATQVAIYVPATIGASVACDNSKQVDETLRFLSKLFGGATAQKCTGAFMDGDELIKEGTVKVYANCTFEDFEKHEEELYNYCVKLRDEMKQICVAFELNGKMAFV